MKKTCSQLKDAARYVMLGHYGIMAAALLVIYLSGTILKIPFSQRQAMGILYNIPSRIIVGQAGLLLVSLVIYITRAGFMYIQLQAARQRPVRFSDLLYGFKNRPDRYIGYWILLQIIPCLCVLPGIICMKLSGVPVFRALCDIGALTSYSFKRTPLELAGCILFIFGLLIYWIISLFLYQTVYLMLDHPEMKVIDAMRTSIHYMTGNAWRLFKLQISFIGWLLLGFFTLFIGYLWILPYIYQSFTQFYLDVVPSSQQESEYQNN